MFTAKVSPFPFLGIARLLGRFSLTFVLKRKKQAALLVIL
jgi:hypothetical protein